MLQQQNLLQSGGFGNSCCIFGMYSTAFEQFLIKLLAHLEANGIDLSISNIGILLLYITIIIITMQVIISYSYSFIPNNWQQTVESIYKFVFSIVSEQAGKLGYKYFSHLYTIFIVILFYNLVGLLPFNFTVSSQVIITFTLALSYFIAWIIVGVINLRRNYLYLFSPKNMPMWLLPLLTCVETLSYFLRPVSLGVRLFANMLAGHILLHILAGATMFLVKLTYALIIPALIVVSAISVLELGISFLQAYIYTILLTIYLRDSLVSH
jgi:F-type H+-transporting ATPase subunit a